MAELLRATRAGGYLLLSVSSALNPYLPWLLHLVSEFGVEAVQRLVETGKAEGGMAGGHSMQLY